MKTRAKCDAIVTMILMLSAVACKSRQHNEVNSGADDSEPTLITFPEEALPCYTLAARFLKIKSSEIGKFGQVAFDVCEPRVLVASEPGAGATQASRLKALSLLDPGSFVANPGISFLRRKDLVAQAQSELKSGTAISQPVILNISAVSVRGKRGFQVDVWTGHEALVALHLSGRKLGAAGFKDLRILVVGAAEDGKKEPHFLRAAGFDFDSKTEHRVPLLSEYKGDKGDYDGSLAVEGEFDNFRLGSRTSVSALAKTMERPASIKVAIQGGTFDPIHEGHLDMSRHVLENMGFTEAVIASNFDTASFKPGASGFVDRVNIISLTLKGVPGINNYLDDFSKLEDTLYPQMFTERIQFLYGTDAVYWLVGADSWNHKILKNHMLAPNMRARYIVFPRQEFDEKVQIPQRYADRAEFLEGYLDRNLSSTKMRNLLGECQRPPEAQLNPKILPYITQRKLYKTEHCKDL